MAVSNRSSKIDVNVLDLTLDAVMQGGIEFIPGFYESNVVRISENVFFKEFQLFHCSSGWHLRFSTTQLRS